jgi:hypothetical protein
MIETIDYYGTQEIRDRHKWIIIPLKIDHEISGIDGNWAEMEEVKWETRKEKPTTTEASTELVDKFNRYHRKNPKVYELFHKFSKEVISTGRSRYSAWAIIQRIRWHVDIKTEDPSGFKINNDYIALYTRLLIKEHPEFKNFFELKQMKR